MNQKHIRLASSISALLMLPALAAAQANDPSAGSSGSNSSSEQAPATSGGSRGTTSGTSDTSSSVNDTGSDTSSATIPSGSSATGSGQTTGSKPVLGSAAQQPIDRSEVQRVFGMDAQLVDLKSLSPDQIRSLQQALQQKGHNVGKIDGVMGPQTRSALMAALANQYALTQRLISQGQITSQLANTLGLNEMMNVSGVDSDPSMHNQGAMQNRGASPSDPASSPSHQRMTPPPVAPSPSGSSPSGTSPIYPSSPEPSDPER